jgi:hypothetical protein
LKNTIVKLKPRHARPKRRHGRLKACSNAA